MIELKDKRRLKTKHFQLENGQKVAELHTAPVHYFNKLGVGDGQIRFREFDWTLLPHPEGGWYFEFNNFIPRLPQFADEKIDFRDVCENKDAIVSFTPICTHVEGRFVSTAQLEAEGLQHLTDVNCVVYDNAFGQGIDLVLYFRRLGLAKVVRMREYTNSNYEFRFKLGLPEGVSLKRKDTVSSYDLLQQGSKILDSNKQTVLVYENGETYFRPFRAWTINGLESVIPVELLFENNEIILTKKLSAELVQSFNNNIIYTDTTTTYYPSADGWFGRQGFSGWASFKSGGGSDWGPTTTDTLNGVQYYSTLNLYRHGFFSFDTSAIPDSDVVSSATLNLYTTGKSLTLAPAAVVVDGTGAITAGNFFNRGTTAWSDVIANATIPTNAYQAWTFNSTGLGNINKTGTTTLVLANSNYELANSDPGGNFEYNCYFSEEAGTSKDPYLSVTYASVASNNSLFFGAGI